VKSFAAQDVNLWHQTWDLWLDKFEAVSRGMQEPQREGKDAPSTQDMKLGVALVPVE
jgi:hypothetical protein